MEQQNILAEANGMTVNEARIRAELETDIEQDLEEEIKDGIYRLALRLHRLYQHRRERNLNSTRKKRIVSEVNIKIKVEGGASVEIKENIVREAPTRGSIKQQNQKKPMVHGTNKKFDWERTLRSGSGGAARPRVAIVKRKYTIAGKK